MTTETTSRFKQSAATGLLIAFLAKVSDYTPVTYKQLSEVAHIDVQHQGRHYLDRARIRVQRDHNKVFLVIPDLGLKLATDAEISAMGGGALRHIHRTARKTREKMTISKLENLSNNQRLAHLASDALLGLQEQATRGIVQKRIEAEFEKSTPKSIEADVLLKLAGVKHIS